MSEAAKSPRGEGSLFFILVIAIVVAAFYLAAHPHLCHGQTPNLVVSGGSAISFTTDSQRPWKRFAVTSPSGGTSCSVVCAEHGAGDDGGIYFYSLTVSAGTSTNVGPVTPPAPVPPADDLPIGSLQTAVSASVAAVDPAAVGTMAASYEALAKQIDAGTIVSPLQLQIATGTQLLTSFNTDQIASLKAFTVAVCGWLDAQQCASKLAPDRMDRYAKAYHAIAWTLKPGIVTAASSSSGRMIYPVERTPPPAAASPCANGHCPAQSQPEAGWIRRRRQ